MNAKIILSNPTLARIVEDPAFLDFVIDALTASGYLNVDRALIREVAGHISVGADGAIRYQTFDVSPLATPALTPMPRPRPLVGETAITFHTHPFGGGHPSSADIGVSAGYGALGLGGTFSGGIWGYGAAGYR